MSPGLPTRRSVPTTFAAESRLPALLPATAATATIGVGIAGVVAARTVISVTSVAAVVVVTTVRVVPVGPATRSAPFLLRVPCAAPIVIEFVILLLRLVLRIAVLVR